MVGTIAGATDGQRLDHEAVDAEESRVALAGEVLRAHSATRSIAVTWARAVLAKVTSPAKLADTRPIDTLAVKRTQLVGTAPLATILPPPATVAGTSTGGPITDSMGGASVRALNLRTIYAVISGEALALERAGTCAPSRTIFRATLNGAVRSAETGVTRASSVRGKTFTMSRTRVGAFRSITLGTGFRRI